MEQLAVAADLTNTPLASGSGGVGEGERGRRVAHQIVEVNVDEADIANIAIGQRTQVYAIAYPDQAIEGVIDSIAVSAKVAEGAQGLSFAVKIRLEKTADIVLRPGMSCRVEIFTEIQEKRFSFF